MFSSSDVNSDLNEFSEPFDLIVNLSGSDKKEQASPTTEQSSTASAKSIDGISILAVKLSVGSSFSSLSISISARLNSLFILSVICNFNSFSCFEIVSMLPDFTLLSTDFRESRLTPSISSCSICSSENAVLGSLNEIIATFAGSIAIIFSPSCVTLSLTSRTKSDIIPITSENNFGFSNLISIFLYKSGKLLLKIIIVKNRLLYKIESGCLLMVDSNGNFINEIEEDERSFKEKRVREMTFMYYSRPDVRRVLFEFARNRECIPRFYEGFGKRPDSFQYEGDVAEFVRRGATSFHCSEEIWEDPLEISTEMNRGEFDELRIGWDLLLDIDSPYLEYSKIFADLIVRALKGLHGINGVGVKFSGSKGFHIIVPWNAFPKEIYGKKTREMFPEWPRAICGYLSEIVKPKLSEMMFESQSLKEVAKLSGKSEEDLVITECLSCKRPSTKKYLVTWVCDNCNKLGELVRLETNKRIPKCPECRNVLFEQRRDEIFFCDYCDIRSDKNSEMFAKTREKTEVLIDADLILVAPRHLFRMPYSLHEKTALASVVIDSDKIKDFQITDARPLKVEVKEFYPNVREGEAKDLLLQALDWQEQKEKDDNVIKEKKEDVVHLAGSSSKSVKKGDFQKVVIEEPSPEIFPPHIKNLLKGISQDGRKRALFILMSFFKSLGAKENYIEKVINEWNDRNYLPLKKGYVQSQFSWYRRNPDRLPPNFDNQIYRELGVEGIDDLVKVTKNPVSYAVKRFFQRG